MRFRSQPALRNGPRQEQLLKATATASKSKRKRKSWLLLAVANNCIQTFSWTTARKPQSSLREMSADRGDRRRHRSCGPELERRLCYLRSGTSFRWNQPARNKDSIEPGCWFLPKDVVTAGPDICCSEATERMSSGYQAVNHLKPMSTAVIHEREKELVD